MDQDLPQRRLEAAGGFLSQSTASDRLQSVPGFCCCAVRWTGPAGTGAPLRCGCSPAEWFKVWLTYPVKCPLNLLYLLESSFLVCRPLWLQPLWGFVLKYRRTHEVRQQNTSFSLHQMLKPPSEIITGRRRFSTGAAARTSSTKPSLSQVRVSRLLKIRLPAC